MFDKLHLALPSQPLPNVKKTTVYEAGWVVFTGPGVVTGRGGGLGAGRTRLTLKTVIFKTLISRNDYHEKSLKKGGNIYTIKIHKIMYKR